MIIRETSSVFTFSKPIIRRGRLCVCVCVGGGRSKRSDGSDL